MSSQLAMKAMLLAKEKTL